MQSGTVILSRCCCPPASLLIEDMNADLSPPARQIVHEGHEDEFQLRDRLPNVELFDDLSSE
jgi:hypothetical protein